MRYDVIALGEVLIDFTQTKIDEDGYPTLSGHPGGAPANFLCPLARYGLKTQLIAKVGDDYFGHTLIQTLKNNNIGTKGVAVDDNYFTTLAFVTLDDKGDRSFSFARKPGADTRLRFEEIDLSLIDSCKIFHFGTLSLSDEPARTATKKIVRYAREKNKLISFDPNLREPLWKNLDDARKAMLYGLKNADIVKISKEEVEFLFDIDIDDACSYLFDRYANISLLYVTCGEEGAYYATRKHQGFMEALKVKAIDTTGAGDIFGGSAMYRFLLKKKKIARLDENDLKDIVRFASVSAGLSTTMPGGISSLRDLEEVERYMEGEK